MGVIITFPSGSLNQNAPKSSSSAQTTKLIEGDQAYHKERPTREWTDTRHQKQDVASGIAIQARDVFLVLPLPPEQTRSETSPGAQCLISSRLGSTRTFQLLVISRHQSRMKRA
jgi:hypothetical protein